MAAQNVCQVVHAHHLLCVLLMASNAWSHSHFRGGSLSFRILDTSDSNLRKVEITINSGWSLHLSPCGVNCNVSSIGASTVQSRQDMIKAYGEPGLFGQWNQEVLDKTGSIHQTDITSVVNTKIQSKVNDLNSRTNWLQEIARFEIDVDTAYPYTDIIFHGISWPNLTIQSCRLDTVTKQCPYNIMIKILSGLRSDTNKPNISPVVLYKPVYRVNVDEITRIPIVAVDSDGDSVRCRVAQWVMLGSVNALPNATITPDCVLEVGPFPGRRDGEWGLVNMVIEDLPRKTITMGPRSKIAFRETLSSIQVEFLIQTFHKVEDPIFVSPSACSNSSNHISSFYVYSGAHVLIPLYARPHPDKPVDVQIDRFHVTTFPQAPVTVSHPKTVMGRESERVKSSTIEWLVEDKDVRHYAINVFAIDSDGVDSTDCTFDIHVKALDQHTQPKILGKPYFFFLPTYDALQCFRDVYCTFPVYAKTDDPGARIVKLIIKDTNLPSVNVTEMKPISYKGEQISEADVTVSSNKTGIYVMCVRVEDSNDGFYDTCLTITFYSLPACSEYDRCGVNGVCHETGLMGDDYVCTCYPGWTGRACDTQYNPCDHNYCSNHTAKCGFIPLVSPEPFCLCKEGFTGTKCEIPPPCYDVLCQNYGVCLKSTSRCLCPLGFEGKLCSNPTAYSQLKGNEFTDVLGFTNEATISCYTEVPCTFAVYSSSIGFFPTIDIDNHFPDMTVNLQTSFKDIVTAVPGLVLTPISATSHTPGNKSLCLGIKNLNTSNSSNCYTLKFVQSNQTQNSIIPGTPTTSSTNSTSNTPRFLFPTPPNNSRMADARHLTANRFIIQTTPGHMDQCYPVTVTSGDGVIFKNPSPLDDSTSSSTACQRTPQPTPCLHEVALLPNGSGGKVCLQVGSGEERCFDVLE